MKSRTSQAGAFMVGFGVASCLLLLADDTHAQSSESRALPTSPAQMASIETKDLLDWRVAEQTDTNPAYKSYLAAHPDGWFKSVALARSTQGLIPEQPELARRPQARPVRANSSADRALWQRALALGTHAAMRDYLRLVENGAYVQDAGLRYLATLPALPAKRPQDCAEGEDSPKKVRGFIVYEAYPQSAIRLGMNGAAVGNILLDYTGKPLAFLEPRYSNERIFKTSVESQIFQMRYKPLRAGCVTRPPIAGIMTTFQFAEATPARYKFRPTPDAASIILETGVRTTLTLPPDQALKVAVINRSGVDLVAVSVKAAFDYDISSSVDETSYNSLTMDQFAIMPQDRFAYLRISGPEKPRYENRGWVQREWNAAGPLEIEISPVLNLVKDRADTAAATPRPTPPAVAATALPTP